MIEALLSMSTAAFLAATVLPFPSEPVFAALQAAQAAPLWMLIAVAGLANTAGSAATWVMGRGARGLAPQAGKSAVRLARAEGWFRRWGRWSLVLSWAPGGDALCLIAGSLRVPFWQFVTIVGLAKTGRYIVLAGLIGGMMGPGGQG